MDDTELLREYVEKGSQPAFARLVEQHVDLVYSAALRRVGGDPHRANEVTQMVFTDLARKATSLTNHPLLAGWLHQSTRWAASGLRRTEQRRLANETAAALAHEEVRTDEAAGWAQLSPLLDEALDTLNSSDREAVLLRFFNDQPFASIGAKLSLTENAARMRVERALDKLHSLLAKRGATSTAATLAMVLTQNAVSAAPAGMATTATVTAMSGASAAVAAALGNLFMTKLQLWLVGVLITGLIAGLSYQHTQINRTEDQIAALTKHRAEFKTSYATLEKKRDERQATLRTLEADAVKLPPLPPLTPEQQERVKLDTLIRKGELDQIYPALFRHLRLSPADLETFKGLLVERNQAIFDANKLAKDLGLTIANRAEAKAVSESGLAEINQRIVALLGSESFEYLEAYEDTFPYRQKLSRFVTKESTPENDLLLDRLTAVYAQACPTQFDDPFNPDNRLDGLPDVFLQAATKLITPQQKQGLEQLNQNNVTMRRMLEIAIAAARDGRIKEPEKPTSGKPASAISKP